MIFYSRLGEGVIFSIFKPQSHFLFISSSLFPFYSSESDQYIEFLYIYEFSSFPERSNDKIMFNITVNFINGTEIRKFWADRQYGSDVSFLNIDNISSW